MTYNTNHAGTVWVLPAGQLVDVSASSISYVPVPFQGRLIDAWSCISAAVTSADTTVTVKKQVGTATAVTLGTITIAATGSAIGQRQQIAMTGSEIDRTFAAGDCLIFDSDGNSSTTSIANFLGVFKGM